MKKFLILLFAVALFTACDESNRYETQVVETETGETVYKVDGVTLHVVEIDGCEYLIGHYWIGDNGYGYLSHKGNCKYCEERRRAEQYNE